MSARGRRSASSRIRTGDLPLRRRTLCPLSYQGVLRRSAGARDAGDLKEPARDCEDPMRVPARDPHRCPRRPRTESGRRASNPRHPAWKAGALPTELRPHAPQNQDGDDLAAAENRYGDGKGSEMSAGPPWLSPACHDPPRDSPLEHATTTGLEPATSAVTGRRSDQLSYAAIRGAPVRGIDSPSPDHLRNGGRRFSCADLRPSVSGLGQGRESSPWPDCRSGPIHVPTRAVGIRLRSAPCPRVRRGERRGCLTGLEPATSRITTGGSDRLSYRHHAGLPLEGQVESTTMVTRRPRAPLLPSISRESDICLG